MQKQGLRFYAIFLLFTLAAVAYDKHGFLGIEGNTNQEDALMVKREDESVMSVTICERESQNISCEGGATISVLEATYGRDDNETCPSEFVLTTNCSAAGSLSVVQGICNDQASCNLSASNSVFGDPCFGTVKYLRVTYECIEAPDPCDSDPCQNGGTCTNLGDNNFECECAPGFGGDICEEELDPCANNPCKNGGTCTDLGDSIFECECATGYTGSRCRKDVDECKDNNGGCQDLCVNTMGSYHCACSDPEFSVAPDGLRCIAEGVDLYCGQDEMTITLPKSLLRGLDVEHLRLIDDQCTATENETHFFLTTRTTECGTLLKHNNDHAIYSNMVSEIPLQENQIVTRVREAMIPFHCFYSKFGVVSSIGIKPISKKVVLSSKGYGEFTISLDVFRNPSYISPYSQDDYPIEFYIRERIYLETCVDSEDDRLTILALECYATPSQDRNSQPRYDVIRDGCSVDEGDTLKFHPSPSDKCQRFSLEAFQYVNKHPYVFFHCKVKICNASDPNSRCAQGCVSRRRRSAKPLPESADDIYALAQGPLTLNREKREAEADDAVNSDHSMRVTNKGINFSVVAALAVVIGACVVGMGYIAWQKKKEISAPKYIPLYEDLQN
ncbi:ZP domain-containing protein-like [Montipora capricornis]|uniref:ZP domain-containing protein-like n=1 Tax=Montipora capricornis TaxID=246305 RepID=UPI0035F10C55